MKIYRVSSSITDVALRPLNMLSICSGIGGLDLGVRLVLGGRVRTVCYVERGLYPAQVMASRMEDGVLQPAPVWSDIKTFDARRWRPVMAGGLLVGGYPCQPFSSSGARRGSEDPKHLWPDVLRVLAESGAGFAFFENVLAHVQRGLQEVLEDLAASGFDAEWGVYSAQQVGAPHIRKRLFIFAFRPAVADAYRQRQLQQGGEVGEERGRSSYCGAESGRPWASEQHVHRLAHRVAHRLDRERATGNAVVPAVAGRAFAELSSRAGVDLRAGL